MDSVAIDNRAREIARTTVRSFVDTKAALLALLALNVDIDLAERAVRLGIGPEAIEALRLETSAHRAAVRPWDGPTGKLFDAACSCGWRGPSIKSHYFIDSTSAHLAIDEHERQVAHG